MLLKILKGKSETIKAHRLKHRSVKMWETQAAHFKNALVRKLLVETTTFANQFKKCNCSLENHSLWYSSSLWLVYLPFYGESEKVKVLQ